MFPSFDWSHLKSFLAVAEHGSLSAAARATGASQPTIGRHIAALEQTLDLKVFDRTPEGFILTDTGAELLVHARHMSAAADRLTLVAAGRSEQLSGTVRITASEIVSAHILPSILTDLHDEEPRIDFEIVASNRAENLLKREADIAVRMFRPTQNDVITRKVGELRMGFFASADYLHSRGTPTSAHDLQNHDLIGYDRSTLLIDGFRQAGFPIDHTMFTLRSDNHLVCWEMVRAGYGIGIVPIMVGEQDERVKLVSIDQPLPRLPVWLAAHVELKANGRIRRVFDFIAAAMQARITS